MFQSVLVPLDGSPFGEHALPLALAIAQRANAVLHLTHVHVPPSASEGLALLYQTLDQRARDEEQEYLDRMAGRLTGAAPVAVKTALLGGAIPESLQGYAAATQASLVVMTTHGRGAVSRFWLGSVADDLVRRLPVPVLLVRPGEDEPDLARACTLRHVLVPLDGSELAEQVLEPVEALAAILGAECTLLRVINPLELITDQTQAAMASGASASVQARLEVLQQQQQKDAQEYLDRVAGRLRARTIRVQTRVVCDRRPAPGILHEASQHGIDCIALATRGRGGLARLLLGSVADKVVRGAHVPVLVHSPRAT